MLRKTNWNIIEGGTIMKLKRILALVLALAMTLALAACGGGDKPAEDSGGQPNSGAATPEAGGSASGETISLTLWGGEEDQTMLADRVNAFKAAYPDQTFDIKIGVESESTAKDTVLTDIEAAADVFAFADDQLADLVDAGALLSIDSMDQPLQAYAGKSVADIKAANVPVSVEAATYNGTMYAFPATADNGYFLYYDSTRITPEQAASWDTLLDAAQTAGSKVGMTLASGWYLASFFYGAGFTTGRNEDGTTTMDWNGTSPSGVTGVQVVQAMQKIAAHPAFLAVTDGDSSNQIAAGNVCAIVSGTWDSISCSDAFGEGYAAAKLPAYMAGDKEVQTGSVAGCKLIGVNAYAENSGWAVLLAEFLTNEESQTIRFEQREAGPSNISAQSSDAVAGNVAQAALGQQSAYAVIQKAGGKYWDPSKSFGEQIAQGSIASDDASVQKALDELVAGVTAPLG